MTLELDNFGGIHSCGKTFVTVSNFSLSTLFTRDYCTRSGMTVYDQTHNPTSGVGRGRKGAWMIYAGSSSRVQYSGFPYEYAFGAQNHTVIRAPNCTTTIHLLVLQDISICALLVIKYLCYMRTAHRAQGSVQSYAHVKVCVRGAGHVPRTHAKTRFKIPVWIKI